MTTPTDALPEPVAAAYTAWLDQSAAPAFRRMDGESAFAAGWSAALAAQAEAHAAEASASHAEIDDCHKRILALRAELETERMRVVACGIVAVSDTPNSAAKQRNMHPDYMTEACKDVARRVDECIALRAERDAAIPAMREYARQNPVWNDWSEGVAEPVPQDPNGAHAWLDRNDAARTGGES